VILNNQQLFRVQLLDKWYFHLFGLFQVFWPSLIRPSQSFQGKTVVAISLLCSRFVFRVLKGKKYKSRITNNKFLMQTHRVVLKIEIEEAKYLCDEEVVNHQLFVKFVLPSGVQILAIYSTVLFVTNSSWF